MVWRGTVETVNGPMDGSQERLEMTRIKLRVRRTFLCLRLSSHLLGSAPWRNLFVKENAPTSRTPPRIASDEFMIGPDAARI